MTKPSKLNKLQLRTLALLQELAADREIATRDEARSEATIHEMPRPHGDHMHVGRFAVSARFASGLANKSVWTALERKGLARADWPRSITLTPVGLAYKTGIGETMLEESDH